MHASTYQFTVQEVHALSHPGSILPVQSIVLWSVHRNHGVHTGSQLLALQRGIWIHQYLDDWLVRVRSHHTCLQHKQTLVALCRELGWLVNKKKSELDPRQVFNFAGYQFDLKECKVRLTPEHTFNQTLHKNLSNLNLHAWIATAIKEQGFCEAVRQHELRHLKEDQPDPSEAKWTIFTKWCLSNRVDFSSPPLNAIADFLLYLFEDRKLQLGTIDGYRSAIADNFPINVSKDENLTRLLASFHRDRPKGKRGISSWNLSLVLHQLTKAPFELLKGGSLIHLTFKTVFLLALGSRKCRSEIHAWLHKNIRHQSDWSKVSLYPSPSFLSKNQLSKDGPDSVAPVVKPALAPTLDKSLKGDRSLC